MEEHRPLTAPEQQALRRFRAALEALLGENLHSVRLFGSRARGGGTLESDLDVLVLVCTKDPALCRRIVEAALDVDLVYDTNVAPTILTQVEYDLNRTYGTPFYRNVEAEGRAL